jgi:hypothetical protein
LAVATRPRKSVRGSIQGLPENNAANQQRARIWQAHPRFIEWHDVWRDLGYAYEGDGPYLTGAALVPHPRELTYAVGADGSQGLPNGEMPKFQRRKQIARYENFASTIVDAVVDHQYAKHPTRMIERVPAGVEIHPYIEWTKDVDGDGTNLTDWLRMQQKLACVYGHLWAVMLRSNTTADGSPVPPVITNAAEQGRLVLRTYTPLDVPDWLSPRRGLITSIKTVEAVERQSLLDPANVYVNFMLARDMEPQDLPDAEFRIWTPESWTTYDKDGAPKHNPEPHGFGELPATILYAKRRARIPVIGQSLMRDPRLYKDHYNLISELREIIRNQTFSMLNVLLGEDEEVAAAKNNLGTHASTETVIFTRGGAQYIAPPDGPAATIAAQIEAVERKVYRLVGLPWEGDSRDAESADSRRIKAADLDRTLAGQADEAQKTEYDICRLWFRGTYGADTGLQMFKESGVSIAHPDEFNIAQVMATIEEARESLLLGLGATANAKIRKQALPIIIKNLTKEEQAVMDAEIDAESKEEAENKKMMDAANIQSLLPPPEEGGPEGQGSGAEE